MGKILGVDYGEKRVGISISDESLFLARELLILHNSSSLFQDILNISTQHGVDKIVVGLPLSLRTGLDTLQTEITRKFAKELEDYCKIAVELVDERMTSKIALKMPKLKNKQFNKDSFAAQLILQSYLDRK